MPGFSSWLKDKGAPTEPEGSADWPTATKDLERPGREAIEQPFLVDNRLLQSKSNGIRYRRSPSLSDRHEKLRPVPFGSTVTGTPEGNGWLRVAPGRYLPISIDGVQVLFPQMSGLEDASTEEDASNDSTDGKADEWRSLGRLKVPAVVRPPSADPPSEAGTGALYEVVSDRVAIRAGPSLGAAAKGCLRNGAQVELFEWDETCLWRRCIDPKTWSSGWMLLDHPEFGPLLRPYGEPLSVKPLSPLCSAAAEGMLAELQRFLKEAPQGADAAIFQHDARGWGPLALAATGGHLGCCVRLIEARADPRTTLEEYRLGSKAGDAAAFPLPGTAALLSALAGEDYDPELLDQSLAELPPEERAVAEALFDKTAAELAARRRDAEKLAEQNRTSGRQVSADQDLDDSELEQPPRRPEERVLTPPPAPAADLGVLHEVTYASVWIRRQPSTTGEQLSKRMKGERVRVLGFDDSGHWGRVVVHLAEGVVNGWMLLRHDELGPLLRAVPEGTVG